MDVKARKGGCTEGVVVQSKEEMGMRKGPWSVEEDTVLINYVATHGDGRWNALARSAGLKRSGKSCRLRWLNYLRPDVRRGNITLQEQITILDLHSQWGNRWSKIAQHLPGRTDNEIKNYWRTRVTKQAKQLNCDVNSEKFRDALRCVWMPLLLERVQPPTQMGPNPSQSAGAAGVHVHHHQHVLHTSASGTPWPNRTNSSCGSGASSDSSSVELQQVHSDSGHSLCTQQPGHNVSVHSIGDDAGLCPSFSNQMFEYTNLPFGVGSGDLLLGSLWNDENIWVLPRLCEDLEIKDNFFA